MPEKLRSQLAELRAWLTSWSGTLAAAAAAIAGLLAAEPSVALFAAELIPAGWPRVLFVIAIVTVTYVLPMKAQNKDGADGSD